MASLLGDDVPKTWPGPDFDDLDERFSLALEHCRDLDRVRAFIDSERQDFPPPPTGSGNMRALR